MTSTSDKHVGSRGRRADSPVLRENILPVSPGTRSITSWKMHQAYSPLSTEEKKKKKKQGGCNAIDLWFLRTQKIRFTNYRRN